MTMGAHERKDSIEPAGVLATACVHGRSDATRKAPGGNPYPRLVAVLERTKSWTILSCWWPKRGILGEVIEAESGISIHAVLR